MWIKIPRADRGRLVVLPMKGDTSCHGSWSIGLTVQHSGHTGNQEGHYILQIR